MIPYTGPPLDTTVPAVVLNLDANPYHHGALGAVRSLGRLGVPVWTVSATASPVTASRYLRGWVHWDASQCTDEEVVDGLLAIGAQLGRYVAVPVDDRSALVLAEHAEALLDAVLLPGVPAALPRTLADKAALALLCEEHGIPSALTRPASGPDDARAFAAAVGNAPYVVKLARPWEARVAGMGRAAVVHSEQELVDLATRGAGRLILQEWLPGEAADPVSHAYVDASGTPVVAAAGRKLRSYPAGVGLTAAGRAEPVPDVLSATLRLLAATGYRGPVDMDWRRDSAGRACLLDVNPRQGAQFRLFERTDGVDLARALHLDVTGRAVGAAPQREPKVFRVEQYELAVAPHYLRRGGVRALRCGSGEVEWAWSAPDDPRPSRALLASYLGKAAGRSPSPGPAAPVLRGELPVRRP